MDTGTRSTVKIFRNIGNLLTLAGVEKKKGRHVAMSDLSIITQALIVTVGDRIRWVGEETDLPAKWGASQSGEGIEEIDLHGATVLPGFIECHTHTMFTGSRANEFELRNMGISYGEISKKGGGILSTVRRVRQATLEELVFLTEKKLKDFLKQGVTTVEIKTGYALNYYDEIKCLEAIAKLHTIRTVPTFLGAHAIPPEFSVEKDYLQFIEEKLLPEVYSKSLSKRLDIYIEQGFFSTKESEKFLKNAKAMGYNLVIHADQMSDSGATELGVRLGAHSVDHVIHTNEAALQALAKSETVAVLLPTADLYLKCPYPQARKLIDAGACVALSTDYNPGTSPTQDISLVGVLARLEMKMTLPEVIAAYTYGAARALRLDDQLGTITEGKFADFTVINKDWSELFYGIGKSAITQIVVGGKPVPVKTLY